METIMTASEALARDLMAQALNDLADLDHAFVTPEGVAKIGGAFGLDLEPLCVTLRASPNEPKGLTLHDGASEARGMCAAALACLICEKLGVSYVEKFGRGSQLRECVRALRGFYGVK